MFRKILSGATAVAAIVAVSVSSQTSSPALAVEMVHVVSNNVELAAVASTDVALHDVHQFQVGRSSGIMGGKQTTTTGSIKIGNKKTGRHRA